MLLAFIYLLCADVIYIKGPEFRKHVYLLIYYNFKLLIIYTYIYVNNIRYKIKYILKIIKIPFYIFFILNIIM